ncbi:MAG: hypothetical protein QXU87_01230 [Candidatus Caldarchaeum sp.]
MDAFKGLERMKLIKIRNREVTIAATCDSEESSCSKNIPGLLR